MICPQVWETKFTIATNNKETNMNFHEEVFQNGKAAALEGRPMSDNPYTKGQWRRREERLAELWLDGWMEGKHPAKEVENDS
jgi:ribosome modulation factor